MPDLQPVPTLADVPEAADGAVLGEILLLDLDAGNRARRAASSD